MAREIKSINGQPLMDEVARLQIEEVNTTLETKADKSYVEEKIGDIDFSDYATKEEVDTKVDKEEGKSLISDTEIERLSNVDNYDDTEIRGLIDGLDETKADKSYVEEKIGDIDFSDYVTNEELADELQTLHTHDNKEILDNITQEDIDLWTEGGNIDLSPYQTIEDNALETDDKTIPGAINEINEFAIILERDGANDLEVFEGYPDLATDDKTIIGAINELDSRLDNISEVVDEQLSSSLTDHIQYQHPSVNSTDELDTINTKKLVDGTLAFVKEENAYYYFTKSEGWQILKTGGTGDGGGSTSAYISSTDAENLTVSTGEDLELHLDFSSPNAGRGTLKIFINDVNSLNVSLAQGETTTVIDGELFSKGNNTLTVYVLDRVGSMSNSLTFYVRYGGTEITTDFDSNASYDYGAVVRFYFVASALDTSQLLSFYMKIDGTLQGSVSCSSDVRSYYTFPNTLSVGSHYCEAWVEDESGTKSNPLTFNLVILDNSSLVVSAEEKTATVEEGSQLSLAYKVYMKNNFSFITKTYINGNLVNTGTCTLETAYYKTSSLTEGVHTIKVEVWDTTETVSDYVTWTVTVTGSTYEMLTPITAGSTFMASAINKSNTDENNSVWIGTNQDNQEIQATLHNFAFNSESGWMDDNLIISGESYVDVPIAPLSENAKYGFTLDIEFSSKQIGVEDAQVLTLWNDTDDCGIKITTEQLIIRSKSGKQCALYFTDDENTSAMFIIDRNEGFAKIYINGVMCEAFSLSDYEAGGVEYLEDFTVSSNIKLGGSGYCRIKNLRVYQIALTTDEILNNFMANETDKTKQKELVEFQKGDTLPTLTIYGDFSGLGKDDKKPCDIVYLSPDVNKYGESFSLLGKYSELQYQGTSSMAYPIKNYRINPKDKNGKVKINPFSADGGQAESRFTLKADFMSSGHWQNTGLARWVSKNLYNYNSNNEGSMNPMRWHLLQNDGDVKTVRDSINGFPCRLILVNDGTSPLAEGQQEPTPGNTKDMGIFNFNNDKDNVATMGLDTEIFPNALSFEVTANSDTSAGAFVPYAEGSNYVFPCFARNDSYLSVCPIKKAPYVGQEIRITDIKGASSVTVYDGHQNGNYGGCIGGDSRYADDFSFICPSNTDYLYMLFYVYVENTWNEPFEEVVSDVSFKLNGIPVEVKWQGSISAYDEFPRNESENAELEYLQQSFELRYPDADDYGEDYGYLGISIPQLHLHVKGDSTYFIPVEHLESKTFSIDFERVENQFLHMIGKRADGTTFTEYSKTPTGTTTIADNVTHIRFYGLGSHNTYLKIGNITYLLERTENPIIEEDPFYSYALDSNYGLKRVIDWVGNCTDEEFLADYEKYFNKHYLLRYYILVITLGMVDNLGKNMMFDTWDGQIWYPRFYDMDTICSYNNSGEIKFDVDIEMEQGYWNTSSSRLWTKVRDLLHNELVEVYGNMRQNGMSYESFLECFYGDQISKIPQKYYNKDYDVKYAPYSDEYIGKAHGDGYQHLKRWLKNRIIFTDTLFDYAPSYTNDMLTIRANTTELMNLTIETYTPVYQHVSWYNGQMSKEKIVPGEPFTFSGTAQTATDQEVLIYGGSNIKKITGISSMNPNELILGGATRLTELVATDCPLLTTINSNKANLSAHSYLNKVDLSGCTQLGGILQIHNSPLLQEVNMKNTAITGIQMPTSMRNLKTLRLPKTINELTLNDAPSLYTLEMEEGSEVQSVSLTNCNNLTETINFDLTKTPTVLLNNSYNAEELYMSETTDLTLRNMPSLERVIYTPNAEYSEFDINNIINGKNYKVTTANCPKLSTFMTTAPHRDSYNNEDVMKEVLKVYETLDGGYTIGGYWNDTGTYAEGGVLYYHYTSIIPTKTTTVHIKTNGMQGNTDHVRATYFKDNTFLSRVTLSFQNIGSDIDQDIDVPNDCNKIIFVCDRTYMSSCTYVSDEEMTIVKDYGDITPNTSFTANTLDLSATQFTDIKLLCTTDVYNLKVPTTMKNFYCDSAMDIDTDVIEDGSYEVIHDELIEEYTTNYEGEVGVTSKEPIEIEIQWTTGLYIPAISSYSETQSASAGTTQFVEVKEPSIEITDTIRNSSVQIYIIEYDKDKNFIIGTRTWGNWLGADRNKFSLSENTQYVRISINNLSQVNFGLYAKSSTTPNIIPSSANGSLIFNMYSNNTPQPTSTSPYMWDLTGLKLNDFYTYGMNNWVKPSDDSYINVNNTPMYKTLGWRYDGNAIFNGWGYGTENMTSVSPILLDDDVTSIVVTSSDGCAFYAYNSTDWNGTSATAQAFPGGGTTSGTTINITPERRLRMFTFHSRAIEWFDMKIIGTTTKTVRYYIADMIETKATETDDRRKIINGISYDNVLSEIKSITMPQRMPGYSVRLVNADITPNQYPTMLYPKLIDTILPITGKLDYTKYNGTSLAWAYAYTTDDVDIQPVDSRSQEQITNDYNKLYGTDFIDIVDVWVYKDTDTSKLSNNENITKAYIELTSSNYGTRVDEVLAHYPNCTDVYFFDDGNVTSLYAMLHDRNTAYRQQIKNVTFMEGYFSKLTDMYGFCNGCKSLESINNIPNSVTNLRLGFGNCDKLVYVSNLPSSLQEADNLFGQCKAFNQQLDLSNLQQLKQDTLQNFFTGCQSLTYAPILPSNYKGSMGSCFSNCKALTTPPIIPNGVTIMRYCFNNCSSLTTAPIIPNGVTDMTACFTGCSLLVTAPNLPDGVTGMNYCFQNCSKLTTAPKLPNNFSNGLTYTFAGCTSLTDISNLNAEISPSDLQYTFQTCTALTEIDLSSWDVSKVQFMLGLFDGCTNVTTINISNWKPTVLSSISAIFSRCSKLTTIIGIENIMVDTLTLVSYAYDNCSLLEQAYIPLNADGYNHAVRGCSALTDIIWVGERKADFNLETLAYNVTYTQEDIKELVPEHLADLGTPYLVSNGTSYIDIPAEDIQYSKITEIELKAQGGYQGNTWIVGANGEYNQGRTDINLFGSTMSAFLFGNGSDFFSISHKDGEIVKLNTTGIYLDDTQKLSFEPFTNHHSFVQNTNFRIFGRAGYQAVVHQGGVKIYHLIFRNGNTVLNNFVPHVDEQGVACMIDTVSNKVYYDTTGTNGLSYGTVVSSEGATLTLDESYGSYLTPDEVFSANAKGWTIVGASSDFTIINANTDISTLTTDESVLSCFIELTNDNRDVRIDEVLNLYPNCGDVYLFDDGSVTILDYMYSNGGHNNANGTRTQVKNITFIDGYFENLVSLMNAFTNCRNLVTVNNIPISKINNLKNCFEDCSSLNCELDFSDFKLNNDNLANTFLRCSSLTHTPILPNNYKGGMSGTFWGCSVLAEAPIIPSGVTALSNCFNGCRALVNPPIIPDGVTVMNGCFNTCSSLTKAPTMPNTVTNLNSCFFNCTSLTEVPNISSKATDMSGCFYGCSKLTTIPNIPKGVTVMQSCFQNCTALTIAPNIPNSVTTLHSCFRDCTALTTPPTIPISCINLYQTFYGCTSLQVGATLTDEHNITEIGYLYYGCSVMTDVDIPLSASWGTYAPLSNCKSLVNINWRGTRKTDYSVTGLGWLWTDKYFSQEDIQELVPEHLGDLYKDKAIFDFSKKEITINNTKTTLE